MPDQTYAADLNLLRDKIDVVELAGPGQARVAVAPAYQGRVMTSTLGGPDSPGFGWINHDFIQAGQDSEVFNNYGGEDRFWLGPEGGQFSLWFRGGQPFDLNHWKTPAGFNTGTFAVTSQGPSSVAMATQFAVANYAGTEFDCAVQRTVTALDADRAAKELGATAAAGVAMVGFESVNTLANAGDKPWTREGGLVSIWILSMLKPLPGGTVIVPFHAGDEARLGPKATTNYFGEIPPERCTVGEDCLLLACDGQFRSKIGISPRRAKSVLGSYDPTGGVLTIAHFNLPAAADKLPYVNSLWEIQRAPFAGDAVNSYNDGEPEPGAGQLGPFYEIETSSPAAELAPGDAITHIHRTFHFAGAPDALAPLAKTVLGVDLADIG